MEQYIIKYINMNINGRGQEREESELAGKSVAKYLTGKRSYRENPIKLEPGRDENSKSTGNINKKYKEINKNFHR